MEQLNAASQKVAELTPTGEEVANLQIREANAHRHVDEAEEKFAALVERVHLDAAEAKRVRKERDKLFQTMARLRRERADAHQ
jgi:hypothetical protein